MIALQAVAPGSRLRLASGAVVEVLDNPRDGIWVIVRRLEPAPPDEAEQMCHVDEIAEVL